jgi:hypothetical protein
MAFEKKNLLSHKFYDGCSAGCCASKEMVLLGEKEIQAVVF